MRRSGIGAARIGAARIGPYRVLRLIRRGGEGSVYLGYDARLQRQVAIKLYHLPAGRRARRKVVEEARIIAGIDSERVVKIHDVILAGHYLAMIMAYVPGTDLETLLESRGALELSVLLGIATDVVAALAAIRRQGIVHGDLKASNVLVSDKGRAVLTDFGIARAPGRWAGEQGAASASALSPEHLTGDPLDVRSDLFALGCLLYRMASGEHPFIASGQLDVARLRSAEAPPLPDTLVDGTALPAPLRELIHHLLQAAPGDRPDNIQRVRQMLRHLAHERPQSLQRPVLTELAGSLQDEPDTFLPPPLPPDFPHRGVSQLADWRGLELLTLQDMRRLLSRRWSLLAIGAALLASGLLLARLLPQPHRVAMALPRIDLSPAARLPQGFTLSWLQEQVCTAALAQNGRLQFYNAPQGCPSAQGMVAGNRAPPPADETLAISLHCGVEMCLLGLARSGAGVDRYHQAVLLPGMPLVRWHAVIADVAKDSFAPT
ncbi:serine/threonine-protein kinase [Parahaliea mediterranea]|uniref:serine/threonine-protein kinase n=1 Tax=Parahaliea mediterranea TaxID=651086 RepID=UPI0013003765|nr:serine/threonine-protein kinase [Parahaliea mediterranea]